MPVYRHSIRRDVVFARYALAALLLPVAILMSVSGSEPVSGRGVLTALGGGGGGIALLLVCESRSQARRKTTFSAFLEADGFLAEAPPSPVRTAAVFDPIRFLEHDLALFQGEANVRWFALHRSGRCYFEHMYATGSAKARTVHVRTVLVFHGSGQAELPALRHGDGPGWSSTVGGA